MRPNLFGVIPAQRPGGSVRLLAKRRAWYEGEGNEQGNGQNAGDGKYNPASLEDANKIIQSLVKRLDERDAAFEAYRKEHSEKLAAVERERRKKLEEEGNYKELLAQTTAELTSLKAYQERAAALEEVIRAGNKALIDRIPEDRRGMVTRLAEKLPPEELRVWLDENLSLLMKVPAPELDAGAGSSGGSGASTPKLTDEEKRMAAAAGMSEKEYAEMKQAQEQRLPVAERKATGS